MTATCPCCGHAGAPGSDAPFLHYLCTGCGHRWKDTSVENVNTYYVNLTDRNAVPPAALQRKFADRLSDTLPLLSGRKRVLEIGCAEGRFGAQVKASTGVHYTGVEPSTEADVARRVLDCVVRGTSAELRNGPYDVLLAFHVLEHIPNVAAELAHWHYLLDAAGTLLLEVPEEAGHRLLSWDAHPEHVHYFTMASLAALCQRAGFQPLRLTSGHFESDVYPDSLRLLAKPRASAAIRRTALLARFRTLLSEPFVVYGIGGDFHNYVEPFLDGLSVIALIDSDPARHGTRIGDLTVVPFDLAQHGECSVLVSSVRFRAEIATWLEATHGVPPNRIVGLDDIYRVDQRRLGEA